jgi:Zn-finger nucleic acid-binding protein
MERATFAARSAVTVDVCNVHGIWFDAGELYRVVLWLSEGGPRLSAAQDPVLVDLERRLDAQSMTYAKGLLPACLRAAGALLRLRVQR